ncbi:uncharacterized protein LOC108628122 [Ceratina calcarata]|uniref:Uncharacterized protein LOC108628122 n=1 Tax=Ceratina calcarata TaxID=156304 RepID=A0AAJ7NA92_9HYME|nr:uncharacterized protein LOC108628122 [Ceratina calcarata]
MIHSFLEEGAWCYWVVSVGALLTFLGLIVACICSCRRNENKNEFLGLAGMVTLKDSDNDGLNRIPTTDVVRVTTQDATDSGKRSTGANRSLPDIPKDKEKRCEDTNACASQDIYETTEAIGDHSELYATVRDAAGKEGISELDAVEVSHKSTLSQEGSDDQYSRFASSPNSDNVEHPYAQLQSVQKSEINQSNRSSGKIVDAEVPSTSANQTNGNPIAPPRTRRSSSHNSLLSTDDGHVTCDIQAANAISGAVQANQDLPYMTPPLLMLLPQPPQPPTNNPQQHFSGDSQDSKGYTSISVREPLANIIAQTKTRQNQSIRPLTDPHYATVSDDSDEMYAAIDEQDKVYTSGSETYAQIQPTMTEVQRVQNEQNSFPRAPSRSDEIYPAPQPPSVDSLRHVAHAHSRQASSSSATSSIINPGSPKPEKRQANSPLPPPPPPPEGNASTTEMYASIEKKTKNEDRLKPALSNGKSLEDMYAKVMKKKKDTEEQQNDAYPAHAVHGYVHCETLVVGAVRKPSLVEGSRISWSSHDSTELQKKESDHLDTEVVTRSSLSSTSSSSSRADNANAALFPARDACDPNYEPLYAQQRVGQDTASNHQSSKLPTASVPLRNSTDSTILSSTHSFFPTISTAVTSTTTTAATALTATVDTATTTVVTAAATTSTTVLASASSTSYGLPFKHRQVSNASSEDPGYEKVRLRKKSEMDQDTDSEPNYESMPHDPGEPSYASVCRPGDSDTDPNYESVNHGDPNYESVKYMSVARSTEEPPYEQVAAYKADQDANGYEKVRKHASFNADYERIHQVHVAGPINGDTDDEQYVQV